MLRSARSYPATEVGRKRFPDSRATSLSVSPRSRRACRSARPISTATRSIGTSCLPNAIVRPLLCVRVGWLEQTHKSLRPRAGVGLRGSMYVPYACSRRCPPNPRARAYYANLRRTHGAFYPAGGFRRCATGERVEKIGREAGGHDDVGWSPRYDRQSLGALGEMSRDFAAAADTEALAASSVRWIRLLVGRSTAVRVALPDRAGRLRTAWKAGDHPELGRRRSARRRIAFEEKRPIRLDLGDVGGRALVIFPLACRDHVLGVLEVLGESEAIEDAWELLETA